MIGVRLDEISEGLDRISKTYDRQTAETRAEIDALRAQVVDLGAFARLMLYSDGVYEIARPDGTMWKLQQFIDFVSGLPRESPVAEK